MANGQTVQCNGIESSINAVVQSRHSEIEGVGWDSAMDKRDKEIESAPHKHNIVNEKGIARSSE